MKPPAIPLAHIRALPLVYRMTIPDEYRDENGHMNMRWYLHLYDEAGYPLFEQFGLTPDYHTQQNTGGFDLEHHIHYLREIYTGDTVEIYARVIARTAKRVHYLLFMVNATQNTLASIFECVNSFGDMTTRRTAPYPDDIARRIDNVLAEHTRLEWDAPLCGAMGA